MRPIVAHVARLVVRVSVYLCVGHTAVTVCGAELSMGPFFVTQLNPTHQLTDPTQPNTNQH